MVNGIPGNMANDVARHVLEDARFELVPYSLTGPEIKIKGFVIGRQEIILLKPDRRDSSIAGIKETNGSFISVDFTHPSAANTNAEFYCKNRLPFVMGTTGGDQKLLYETVAPSSISAVIAPNMAKQIVAFQAMMDYVAGVFPNLFSGYSLEVRESHQKGKADTSGTAKAVVGHFNRLGIPFSVDKIEMERNPDTQLALLGVPERYLSGHGWHTYTLRSEDGTVKFEFTHNVNGREVYAQGTLDAIAFLNEKMKQGSRGKIFTMMDVLRG